MSSEDDFDDVPSHREPSPDRRPGRRSYDDDRDDFREPPLPPRKPGFGFWLAVAWTALYFVATQIVIAMVIAIPVIIIAMILDGINGNPPPNDVMAWMQTPTGSTAMLIVVAGSQFGGLVVSWILLRVWCGKTWKRKIALTRLPTPTHALLVLLGFPAMIALSAGLEIPIRQFIPSMQDILQAIGLNFQMDGTTEAILAMVKNAPWLLAIFVVAVSPGICEEVFCRGFLAQGLSGRYSTWAVVLIVSFLFGCLHGDPQQGFGAMCLGAVIHGAYVATRSLVVAMLVHFANNALAVIHVNSQLFPILEPFEQVFNNSPVLFLSSAGLLFAAVCYALYQTRSILVSTVPGMPTWEPEGVSGVELPPPDSSTVVSHDRISLLSVALVFIGAVAFGLVMAFA
jgi:membrane protease YdiL (CAAX protease family)